MLRALNIVRVSTNFESNELGIWGAVLVPIAMGSGH